MEEIIKNVYDAIVKKSTYSEISSILSSYSNKKCKNTRNKNKLEHIIRSFRDRDRNYIEILSCIIFYVYLFGDEAVDFARKRGVFAYYLEWDGTKCILEWLNNNCSQLPLTENTKNYVAHKYDVSWLAEYYRSFDEEILSKIEKHESDKNVHVVNSHEIESNLVVELLVCTDLLFRIMGSMRNSNVSASIEINRERNYDCPNSYSIEQIAEAASFIISKYCEHYLSNLSSDRTPWIDSESFMNDIPLAELILLVERRNKVAEWEIMVDYYGYDILRDNDEDNNNPIYRIIDKKNFEKSICLGYIKTDLQQEANNYSNLKSPKEVAYLTVIAEKFRKNLSLIFELKDKGTFLERYRLIMYKPLIDSLVPSDHDNPTFFMEEYLDISQCAHEMLISEEDLLKYEIGKLCTVKDVILFKRFFIITALLQQVFYEEHKKELALVAKSIIPVFCKEELFNILFLIVGNKNKVSELLDMFIWKREGTLDLQTTPIIKLNDKLYFLSPYILTSSNLIRNSIVKGRKGNVQITNSDGTRDALEHLAKSIFETRKDIFGTSQHCNFLYNDKSGEVDLIAWSDNHLYLIECKNTILPSNSFELRTTYDYIAKAEEQLDLSYTALNDNSFREDFFIKSGVPVKDYEIHTLILLGNRLFTIPNGFKHPVRYIHELKMIMTCGILSSSLGKWRYWEKEQFSEKDLLKFISSEDPLSRTMMDAMESYKEIISCGKHKITNESYSLNYLKHIELNDKCFVNLSSDEHIKKRCEFKRMSTPVSKNFLKNAEKH